MKIYENSLLGPGTDLAITLLGTLLIIFAINEKLRDQEKLYKKSIQEQQKRLICDIASEYDKAKVVPESDKIFKLYLDSTRMSKPDIVFNNDATLQRIRFSDKILFESDKHVIKDNTGEKILKNVGDKIFNNIESIKEIIIEGHTDNGRTKLYKSNLHLGMERAITIFDFLKDNTKLDPNKQLISASTYGEYKPVQRNIKDLNYNEVKTYENNSSKNKKALNRRIDIFINYGKKNEKVYQQQINIKSCIN